MNYQKLYNDLIQKRRLNPLLRLKKDNPNYIYVEEHHIIPRSLGGLDNKENLIFLTAREHFIAHLLLVKIYQNDYDKTTYYKMCNALSFFKYQSKDGIQRLTTLKHKINSRLFEKICVIGRKSSGKFHSKWLKSYQLGKKWITNGIENHFLKPEDAEKFLKENPTWKYGQKFKHRKCSAQAKANRLNGMKKSLKYQKRFC